MLLEIIKITAIIGVILLTILAFKYRKWNILLHFLFLIFFNFMIISHTLSTNQPTDFIQFEGGTYSLKYIMIIMFIIIIGLLAMSIHRTIKEEE